jgi:Flp pilus assembly protein TadD
VGALMLAATIYDRKGDVPKAREAYEKVLAFNPRFALAANNLAYLYSEHGGDAEKALQLAQTAREAAPEDPYVADTLGWILYKRGVHQRALTLFQESAGKLPDNAAVQYHLGMAAHKLGDRQMARDALTRAVGSPTDSPWKAEARKVLAELK